MSLLGMLFGGPFAVMNTVGLVAFAFVGASKAINEEFDLLGITIVGLSMAFAGGVTRDLLVNRVPLALQSPVEVALAVAGVSLAVALNIVRTEPETHPLTLASDGIGLAAFATTGAIVATQTGLPAFGVVAVATINAVGGGALADILLDRAPFILFEDFYASCAILGGVGYWLVGALGGPSGTAAVVCAAVTVGTRFFAVTYGWALPTVQDIQPLRE